MKIPSLAALCALALPVLADYGLSEMYELSLPNSMSSDDRFKTHFYASGSAVLTSTGPGGRSQISLTELGRPNQRGAVSGNHPIPSKDFISEVSLAVYGPVLPGGGFGIFFTPQAYQGGPVYGMKDGWNGLALILDSVIGSDGEGHLHVHDNTGGSYSSMNAQQVEKDALALCKLKYRNTGAPVKITTYYIGGKLKVEINGHKCFDERPVALPDNPHFSISAASTEGPDTFEIYSLKTYKVDPNGVGGAPEENEEPKQEPKQEQAQPQQQQQQQQAPQQQIQEVATPEHIAELAKKLIAVEEKLESFTDLKKLSTLSNDLLVLTNRIGVMDQKLREMEVEGKEHVRERAQDTKNYLVNHLQEIKTQLHSLTQTFDAQVKNELKSQFSVFSSDKKNQIPSLWLPLVVIVGIQSALFFVFIKSRGKYEKLL
ncbi:hypothetical protein CJU89_0936 [Yarrowia sp. B02]|nr:hypothetical protein CJU89_0936 [Yarrowia sp. B02]